MGPVWSATSFHAVRFPCIDSLQKIGAPIKVNSKLFGVPTNFWWALKRLRNKAKPVILWAGSICIDISSPEERTWHAFYSVEIFKRAVMTIAWIGEERHPDALEEWLEGQADLSTGPDANHWPA